MECKKNIDTNECAATVFGRLQWHAHTEISLSCVTSLEDALPDQSQAYAPGDDDSVPSRSNDRWHGAVMLLDLCNLRERPHTIPLQSSLHQLHGP